MRRAFAVALGFGGTLAIAATSVANAQATRTWVSGIGDDVNPCSRTAPCKTFAGAISKTAAGGEINCIDPAGYGAVTITKSMTIDCHYTLGGILSANTTGVIVNGANVVVTLRGLDINGVGTGIYGVRFVNGKQLNIENSTISGVTQLGVWVQSMVGAGGLVIKNSTISNNVDGVVVDYGVATVSNSVISGNLLNALLAENTGVLNADSNLITNNGTAVQAGNGGGNQSTATVRISNNDVYGNQNGFVCGGGVLASDGSNRKGNNSGGTGAVCAPNAVITKQ